MYFDPKPGDTVSVQLYPSGRHEGIVGRNGYIIARSRRLGGVFAVPPSEFSNGKLRTNHGYIGVLGREQTLKRAEAMIGERGYNVISNNCLHFVNLVNGLPRDARMNENVATRPGLHDLATTLKRFRRFIG